MHTVLPRRLPEQLPEQVLKKAFLRFFASISFFFFHNKAEKIDVILEIIMLYVQASEALS